MGDVNYEPLFRGMTWSFSRVRTFQTCPQQGYLHYLMGLPEEEMFYSSYGSFCHDLIARYYTGELKQDELLPEFLQGFPFRVMGERPSPKIERKYLDQGAEYFEKFQPFPLETLAVEKELRFAVDDVQFVGFLDYLGKDSDGRLILVDHKSADLKPRSTRGKYTRDDQKLDDTLMQLYLYSKWVHDQYGEYPSELWLNCFRTGVLIREPFSVDSFSLAEEWALKSVRKLYSESDFFPEDDWYYCRWVCGMHNHCDLYQDELAERRRRR